MRRIDICDETERSWCGIFHSDLNACFWEAILSRSSLKSGYGIGSGRVGSDQRCLKALVAN